MVRVPRGYLRNEHVNRMPRSGLQREGILSLCTLCGILGPISFAAAVMAASLLRPGYDHATQLVSDLGGLGAPRAAVMNLGGFILPGILTIAFAVVLHRGINQGRGSKVGPGLVAAAGVGLVAAGVFQSDPTAPRSVWGIVHDSVIVPMFIGQALAPLVLSQRLKNDRHWRAYRWYSLGTGLVALAVLVVFFSGVFQPWEGAVQRLFAGVLFLWTEVMALRLFWLYRRRLL